MTIAMVTGRDGPWDLRPARYKGEEEGRVRDTPMPLTHFGPVGSDVPVGHWLEVPKGYGSSVVAHVPPQIIKLDEHTSAPSSKSSACPLDSLQQLLIKILSSHFKGKGISMPPLPGKNIIELADTFQTHPTPRECLQKACSPSPSGYYFGLGPP